MSKFLPFFFTLPYWTFILLLYGSISSCSWPDGMTLRLSPLRKKLTWANVASLVFTRKARFSSHQPQSKSADRLTGWWWISFGGRSYGGTVVQSVGRPVEKALLLSFSLSFSTLRTAADLPFRMRARECEYVRVCCVCLCALFCAFLQIAVLSGCMATATNVHFSYRTAKFFRKRRDKKGGKNRPFLARVVKRRNNCTVLLMDFFLLIGPTESSG